jgi:circadian clock protein KaiC
MMERVPTGIDGFDELIENGLPKESVIIVAGNPGAGKTTFAAQFLHTGATKLTERGIYVCFAETRESLIRNLLRFGWNFEKLEREGRISILDLSTTKEPGIQSNLNLILDKINDIGAERLVIDSFSAFSMALTEAADIRFLIHLLYRFVQKIGCTTILISDTPWGSQKIGSGVEEFIADGIILMQTKFDENSNLKRTLSIIKMRSTNHSKKTHEYEITSQGIHIISNLKEKE